MNGFRWALLCLSFTTPAAWAISPTFGNLNVEQHDALNLATSVTVTTTYVQSALSADGTTSLGTLQVRPGSNRGDFNVQFTSTPAQDRAQGILITNISENGRNNNAYGDTTGLRYATSAIANSNGYYIPVHHTGGNEWNSNLAAAWFPYADGWIGGHAVNTAEGLALSSIAGSSGLSISATAAGPNIIYDNPETNGIYELNLAGINSQTDGILIVVGGGNLDNYALSRANADGSWTVVVKDNGSDGTSSDNDGFGFVYVPKTSVVEGNAPGIHAMGRLNGNLTRDISAGDYIVVRSSTGIYKMYAPGINSSQATLLLSPESAGVASDNFWTYQADHKGWVMRSMDLPGTGLQDNTDTADTLSFILMAGANTSAIWDGTAAGNWTSATNWKNDVLPTSGQDIVIGAGTGNVTLGSAQTAGMVMLTRSVGFTLAGPAALTLTTGLAVNSQPTASQTYIVSTPLILAEDAFIYSQSIGSAVTLRLDVASGNAITSDGKSVTLGGAGNIEIRDPIALGTGKIFKEGSGQVTLLAGATHGGMEIYTGPNSTTSGAIRLNAPAAYGAFGSGVIYTGNSGSMTALFFDLAAGSGTLSNNLVMQSAIANSDVRILLDASADFNVTMSGVISGGNITSQFIVDNDVANGQGRLHLTNVNNTFTTETVNVNRGAVVVYGDGSLGNASNSLYLNTNVTDGAVTGGLHFGADNVVLNAGRAVTLNTTSPINTGAYNATVAGTVSGNGGLIKGGSGTLELTGTNAYLGATTIKAGTLMLNPSTGSAAGAGAVTVEGTATLAGRGDVSGSASVLAGGRLSPGVGSTGGMLNFINGLDLQGDARVVFDLKSALAYGRVNVSGGSFQTSGSQVLEVLLSYVPSAGDTFDLLDWVALTGDVTLQDNLVLPDISQHGLMWDRSLFDGSGVLSIQFVPEPSRMILLAAGLCGVFMRRRRSC